MGTIIGSLELFSVDDLAVLLKVQPKTIREMLKQGRLKGRKFARRWYVTEENLRDYFSQPEPHPADDEDAA